MFKYQAIDKSQAPPDAVFDREVIRSSEGYGQSQEAVAGPQTWSEQGYAPLFRRTRTHDGSACYFRLKGA